ncbi:MAG: hypothetical protein Q6361_05245 [Candidatus Hermodarchaeota archaeon]|nr:hypothetical protein [Candidatus Hermodarchaeota archaeon]
MAYGTFSAIETVIIGGWFVIIGYFLLLFIYYLAFRFRESKNPFHLGFGLFFLLLGVARAFFLAWDYYILDPLWWLLATIVSWLAIFTVFLALAYQIIERQLWQILLISSPPLIIAILIAALPGFFWPPAVAGALTIGYLVSNLAILPIYVIVLPVIFFWIGLQLKGQLRRSNFLLGTGFLIYYVGRVAQSSLATLLGVTGVILAPILVFVALVLIAMGMLLEERE